MWLAEKGGVVVLGWLGACEWLSQAATGLGFTAELCVVTDS